MIDNFEKEHDQYLKEMSPKLKNLKKKFEIFSTEMERYCFKLNKKSTKGFVKCNNSP